MRAARKILAATAVSLTMASASVAAATEYVYGSWFQPQHGINVYALDPYFKAVEAETKGSLKWRLLTGGQLLEARNSLSGIKERLADAGFVVPAYVRKELAHSSVLFDMQMFGANTIAALGAAIETVMLNCPECQEDYRKYNAVMLGGSGTSPYLLMCAKPVRTVADVSGLKVRAVGPLARLTKALGGTPLNMPASEGVGAMQRGALDCILGPGSWLKAYGYKDVAKYVLDYPFGTSRGVGMFVMNRDSWKQLAPEQRRAMLKHMGRASAETIITAYVKGDQKVIEQAKTEGVQVIAAGKDFDEVIAAHQKGEVAAIPAEMRKLGVQDPERIMATFEGLYPKWEKLSQEIGLDVVKYGEALQREVYDKLDPEKL